MIVSYDINYADQISKLIVQARDDIPSKRIQQCSHHISEQNLIDRLNNPYPYGPYGTCYVEDNSVHGCVIYLEHTEFVYFKLLIVDRCKRNKRIGSALTEWFTGRFKEHGIISQTFSSNYPMKKLFASHKFNLEKSITNERVNGDATEWYSLNINSDLTVKHVLAGKFDLCY